MPGGLLQLVSNTYNDNFYLTNTPELSFFNKVYHKHTNFTRFTNEIKFNTRVNFGSTQVVDIPKNGDLLDNIKVKLLLPKLECKYSLSNVEEYNKQLSLSNLQFIDKNIGNNIIASLDSINSFLSNPTYNILLQPKPILINGLLGLFSENANNYNKTFYLTDDVLESEYTDDSPIFVDLNLSLDKYSNKIPSISSISNLIYTIYGNHLYGHNYHPIFSFLLHLIYKYRDDTSIINSPNIYLYNLYNYFKKSFIYHIETNSIHHINVSIFSKNKPFNIYMDDFISDLYIIKIGNISDKIKDNLKLLINDDAIIIWKKDKFISDNDTIYNYTWYYQTIATDISIGNSLKRLTNNPLKVGLSIKTYYIKSIITLTDTIQFTLNHNNGLKIGNFIYGYTTKTITLLPDVCYKITAISNKVITCSSPNFSILNSQNEYSFSDGINDITTSISNITNIFSNVITNYNYLNELQSDTLSSYIVTDYMTHLQNISIELFDVYQGDNVPDGSKSLAYRITLQSVSKTLAEEDIDLVVSELLCQLEKVHSATLR